MIVRLVLDVPDHYGDRAMPHGMVPEMYDRMVALLHTIGITPIGAVIGDVELSADPDGTLELDWDDRGVVTMRERPSNTGT
jgi:hypothetical protein